MTGIHGQRSQGAATSARSIRVLACCGLLLAAVALGARVAAGTPAQEFYTVQLESFSVRDNAVNYYAALARKLTGKQHGMLRVERIGPYYAMRVGEFADRREAQALKENLNAVSPGALIIKAQVLENRLVIASKTRPGQEAKAPAAVDGQSAPSNPQEQSAAVTVAVQVSGSQNGKEPGEPVSPEPEAAAGAVKGNERAQQEGLRFAVKPQEPPVGNGELKEFKLGRMTNGFVSAADTTFETLKKSPLLSASVALAAAVIGFITFMLQRRDRKAVAQSHMALAQGVVPAGASEPRPTAAPGGPPRLTPRDEGLVMRNSRELSEVEANLLSVHKGIKTVYVTSCFQGEGKTTAALQLAYALSMHRISKVLLVDWNSRSPQVHVKFNTSNKKGYCGYLQGGESLDDVIQNTHYEGLSILPFEDIEKDYSEMIKRELLREKIAAIKERFDYVVFDGHSILSSSAAVLADLFDGVVIVVEAERTKWEVVQVAGEKISNVGGNFLGTILNKRKFYIPKILYGKI